jgi:rod shape-determining protein MreB and related proteins
MGTGAGAGILAVAAMITGVTRAFSDDIAIDLGTANTLVYARGEGIVVNEPSVIALNSRTRDVLAMGHEAWQMIGRTPSTIVARRPLRQGAITDFDVTQRMIRLLLQRARISRFGRPRVVICVPCAITTVEQRAVLEATRRAGAVEAHLLEQPMAAAIGAGLPIGEPLGSMVVDIGGGTTEVALISLGGVVALEAVRVGSFDIDAHIQTYLRREYGIAIGERTAEDIKVTIGSAWPAEGDGVEYAAEVRGRELMSGLPRTVVLSAGEVRDAIDEPVSQMIDAVVTCLGQAPPELAQDLIEQGVFLTGGGGLLRGLDRRLEHENDVPVHLVDAPLECVVLGAGRCVEAFDDLKVMFME